MPADNAWNLQAEPTCPRHWPGIAREECTVGLPPLVDCLEVAVPDLPGWVCCNTARPATGSPPVTWFGNEASLNAQRR
jgi:hypothetical protein